MKLHGYIHTSNPNHVCRHRKALYGLKQSLWAWYQRFDVYLLLRIISSKSDTSLFTFHQRLDTIYIFLYVDDIILDVSSPTLIWFVISWLSTEFAMTDPGSFSFFF